MITLGPALASEIACVQFEKLLRDQSLEPKTTAVLVDAIQTQSLTAPWSCLVRTLFDHGKDNTELQTALRAFWNEVEGFSVDPKIISSMLAEYRHTRKRPRNAAFYSWLKYCGVSLEEEIASDCHMLLRQLSPSHGSDIVETIEQLLREKPTRKTISVAIKALARVAREGQPEEFRINETKALPDYDADLREGANYLLCRFINSPESSVSVEAAQQLARSTGVQTRAWDNKKVTRWRFACRLAYFPKDGLSKNIPLLGVWTGDRLQAPDYSLHTLVDRKICQVNDEHPVWFCGTTIRRNGITMRALYAGTGFMEWDNRIQDRLDLTERMMENGIQ